MIFFNEIIEFNRIRHSINTSIIPKIIVQIYLMLSKRMCIIHPVVSVSTLIWFIRYIHYSLHNVIMNKTKVLSPQVPPGKGVISRSLAILFRPFGVMAPTTCIWLSNISMLSVPDEGYSRNASCALNLISTFLFDHSHLVTAACLSLYGIVYYFILT
jgi:hypothetical protein